MFRVIHLPTMSLCGDWYFEAIVQRSVNGIWTDVIEPRVY